MSAPALALATAIAPVDDGPTESYRPVPEPCKRTRAAIRRASRASRVRLRTFGNLTSSPLRFPCGRHSHRSEQALQRCLRRFRGALTWSFPGHGEATVKCGLEVKVGHRKSNGRWCLWDQVFRCPSHECPECFDKGGGYASREAEEIDARVDAYMDMRNVVSARSPYRLSAVMLERQAEHLLLSADDRREHETVPRAIQERARRLLMVAERDQGRSRVRRPIHIVVCPPPDRWDEVHDSESYRALRFEGERQARARGVDGAVSIFHHMRLRSSRWDPNSSLFEPGDLDVPGLGPHWHLIGDGWVTPRGPFHEARHSLETEVQASSRNVLSKVLGFERLPRATVRTQASHLRLSLPSILYRAEQLAGLRSRLEQEWVIVNLGVRVSVYQTAFYCLTHAGFARRHPGAFREAPVAEKCTPGGGEIPTRTQRERGPIATVVWFGTLSARSFRFRELVGPRVCERCGEEITSADVVPMAYMAAGPPPKGDVDGDPDDWRVEGLGVTLNRAEASERLRRRLSTGAWTIRKPATVRGLRGLDLLVLEQEVEQEYDVKDRREADRSEYSATHESHSPPRRGPRRKETRDAFNEAMREARAT